MDREVDGLSVLIRRMKFEPWVQGWWAEHQKRLETSPLKMMTMTFCIKPTRPVSSKFVARMKALPNVSIPVVPDVDGPPRRGRKRRPRKAFPNLNSTLKIDQSGHNTTLKVFKNSSMQACGCKSWDQMLALCRLNEEKFADEASILSVDVNNITLYYNITERFPEYIPNGTRLSLSQISTEINLVPVCEYGEWEECDFHKQARQTNLNLWWCDMQGKRHYASVYPRGTMRLTTVSIDIALYMYESLMTVFSKLHGEGELTCIDISSVKPQAKDSRTSPFTTTAVDTAFLT